MKKLLALVLALVMTLGLATVGANAAYKDADDINYKEAVDVMSAIGVLAGDETGFRPADTLKRSEGAKIIAYLIAGNATADAMTATGTKYTDLPANHWAAGYMEYLSAIGVMGGLGNGTIDPDGSLSATAFAKMLLVALGYDATIEKMGGADWQINTQRLANKNDLFKGNSAVVGSAAVTREEAALYALNTLKAPLVEYETKGTVINVGDASITTGASNATYMTTTDSSARYRNIDNARVNGNGAQIVEFAEQYYDGLKLADAGTDAFGRPANVWTLKGKEVGTYSKSADLQYTEEVKMGTIYADLGLTGTIEPAAISVYEDGVIANNTNPLAGTGHADWTTYRLMKNSDKKLGGNGALTEVYYDDDTNTVEIFVTNTYFAKIAAAYAASSTKDAYVTLGTMGNKENTGTSTTYDTDSFKAGDYVLYTASYKDVTNGVPAVKSMELADAVQGTLTAYQVGTNVTVDGTVIKSNVVAASKATIGSSLQNAVNTTVTVFKDKNGFAVAVDATAAQDNYAVVLGWTGNDTVGNATRTATLLLLDGTKKSVTVDSLKNAAGATIEYQPSDKAKNATANTDLTNNGANRLNIGDVVTYRITTDGKYKLTLAQNTASGFAGRALIANGVAKLNGNTGINNLATANGKTVFALWNSNTGSVNVYTGIANVPDVTIGTAAADAYARATAYDSGTDGVADLVFVDVYGATVKNSSKDVIFIKGGSAGEKYDSIGGYYEYDAIINDVIGKIKVDEKVGAYYMVTNMSKNSDEVYDWSSKDDAVTVSATAAQSDDAVVVTIGTDAVANGTAFYGTGAAGFAKQAVNMASNPKVFNINTSGTISESTLGAIQLDANDQVFWKETDGLATTIVFITKDNMTLTGGVVANTDIQIITTDVANAYLNPTYYIEDAATTATRAEVFLALKPTMESDGCTAITYNAGTYALTFTKNGVNYSVTFAPVRVYKVTYGSSSKYYPITTTIATINTAFSIGLDNATKYFTITSAAGVVEYIGFDTTTTLNAALNSDKIIATSAAATTVADAVEAALAAAPAGGTVSVASLTPGDTLTVPADKTLKVGTLTQGGNKITVNGALEVTNSTALDAAVDVEDGGTLNMGGTTTGDAHIHVLSGGTATFNNYTIGGNSLEIDSGASATVSNTLIVGDGSDGTLTNNGSLTVKGAMNIATGGTLVNNGTLEAQNGLTVGGGGTDVSFTNKGTITVSGGNLSFVAGSAATIANANGTINVTNGNLVISDTGAVTLKTGIVNVSGDVTLSGAAHDVIVRTVGGAISLNDGSKLEVTNASTVSSITTQNAGDTLKVDADMTVNGAVTLAADAAADFVVDDAATVTIEGAVTLNAGGATRYLILARAVTLTTYDGTADASFSVTAKPKTLIRSGNSTITNMGKVNDLVVLSDACYGTSGSNYLALYHFSSTYDNDQYYYSEPNSAWVDAKDATHSGITFFATENTNSAMIRLSKQDNTSNFTPATYPIATVDGYTTIDSTANYDTAAAASHRNYIKVSLSFAH